MSAQVAVRVVPLPETVSKRAATKVEYTAALARWRKHPLYNGTMARHLVEDVHAWFRSSFSELAVSVQTQGAGDLKMIDAAWFETHILLSYKRALRNLEGHHNTEDRMLFPLMRRQYPETVEGCDELERDHQLLHPLESIAFNPKYDIEMRANAVIEFYNFLDDHLMREEILVVPLILAGMRL